MSTWKKILTEDDGNLATNDLTIDGNLRSLSLGNSSGVGVFAIADNSSNGILTVSHDQTPDEATVTLSGLTRLSQDAGSNQGTLRLFEGDVSSNYIDIKAPTLSGNYTLTLPTTDGSADQVLKTDGSGNLSWVSQTSGGGVTINSNTNDYILTATGTANTINGESQLTFDGVTLKNSRHLEYQPDAGSRAAELYDGSDTGPYAATANVTAGDLTIVPKSNTGTTLGRVYTISSSGQAELVSAANGSTNIGKIALLSPTSGSSGSSATQNMYLRGMATLRSASFTGTFAYGTPIYLNPTTSGGLTFTQPSTTNQYVRRMGYAINAVTISTQQYYIIWFDPSHEYIQIA